MAREFVLLRLTGMRGVDLNVFDFDFDLTWAGLFVNADGTVYGRYGGRGADSADGQVSLAGLRYAMSKALAAHRDHPAGTKDGTHRPPRTVEQFPAARRLKANACVHCHQVYDFRREALQDAGKWRLDEVWVYPHAENVGLTLDVSQGDRVRQVEAGSPAGRIGLRAGDRIERLNGVPVASLADVQYALHRAPARGQIPVAWRHDGNVLTGTLDLADGWRKTDVSWRWSLRGLDPQPGVDGEDLSGDEKKALGLAANALALRQGPFVTPQAQQAGLQPNDVIIGVGGKTLAMNGRQFATHVRLNFRVGDVITLAVLRSGRRLDLPMKLTGRPKY